MLDNVAQCLQSQYPEWIKSHLILYGNELYLDTNPPGLAHLCRTLHNKWGGVLLSLFANDERKLTGGFALYYVFALREAGKFVILKCQLDAQENTFPSITKEIHAAHLYEREIKDLYGLTPLGHPDQRPLVFHGNWPAGHYPLRKDYPREQQPPREQNADVFTKVEGHGVYEISVGPVHAGIIEPGHFHFSVAGEPVIQLEAQLYYVHKGLEKLAETSSIEKCCFLAERISGDETFANSLAYCQAIEKIAAIQVPERAEYSRVVFAELERLTSHLGDLAGICLDVAYGFAAFQFRLLRGWSYLLAEELCKSRFLRSVNQPGGLRKDFLTGKEQRIIEALGPIRKELEDTVKIIKANSLFIDRVEHTGVLKHSIAVDMNTVGPAARATGIYTDLRQEFPYAAYDRLQFTIPEHHNGDVNCRMNVKIEECFQAIDLMLQAAANLPVGRVYEPIGHLEPYRYALGYSEAARGENIHWVMTGENDTIFRYKVRTPSFCNWPALCHAVKGNIVPDFPLINKSFNLSYAGNDL